MLPRDISKRAVLGLAAGAAAAGLAQRSAAQAPATVKLAIIVPLSGPWATTGLTIKDGVDFAVDDVNRGGGIRSLGGARLEVVSADAEDSAEKARTRRSVCCRGSRIWSAEWGMLSAA